jgi:hypothetical protein
LRILVNALALTDVSAGYASTALGLTSLYGFVQPHNDNATEFTLMPEISAAAAKCPPLGVAFVGDNHSGLDVDTSIAAVRLAKLLPRCPVGVLLLDVNEPKDIVDCRALLGPDFESWFKAKLNSPTIVPAAITPETLAYILLKRQLPFLVQRWPYDRALRDQVGGFLMRTKGDFRLHVIDLLDETLDGLNDFVTKREKELGNTPPPEQGMLRLKPVRL